MAQSEKCDTKFYWDREKHECVLCSDKFEIREGFEFTSHCGRDDEGGRPDATYRGCPPGTYNDGKFTSCQRCSICDPKRTVTECNNASDTRCCADWEVNGVCGSQHTELNNTEEARGSTVPSASPPLTFVPVKQHQHLQGIIPGAVICFVLLGLLCFIIIRRRKGHCKFGGQWRGATKFGAPVGFCSRGRNEDLALENKAVHDNQQVNGKAFVQQPDFKDPNNFLAPKVQAAPLETVLNNLDVLEELKILLDPDTTGIKNTRHLAALCSYPYTWINYAYSMRDSKSPLTAVLEGLVSKHPDWNVGHLAQLLIKLGRTDAVAVLAKLPVLVETV